MAKLLCPTSKVYFVEYNPASKNKYFGNRLFSIKRLYEIVPSNNRMLTYLITTENAHLIINATVIVFLVVSTIYNWKLLKDFSRKISKAYQAHKCAQNRK